jgi:hypothetical protein
MSRAQQTSTVEQNTGGAVAPYVAGKNFCINGGLDIWQRGTSFSTGSIYNADRWWGNNSVVTTTWSQESTIVPTGFTYSMKVNQATNAAYTTTAQPIETANAIKLTGQTVVLSMYLASSTSMTLYPSLSYSTTADNAPSGTWTSITPSTGGSFVINSTTFTRCSTTFVIPSTAKSLKIEIINTSQAAGTSYYFTGVQLELGSVATAFSRAGGTLQGELAACQRYYWRTTPGTVNGSVAPTGSAKSTTVITTPITNPVAMRITPTSVDYSSVYAYDGVTSIGISSVTLGTTVSATPFLSSIDATGVGMTLYRPYYLYTNSTSGYLGFSAEL